MNWTFVVRSIFVDGIKSALLCILEWPLIVTRGIPKMNSAVLMNNALPQLTQIARRMRQMISVLLLVKQLVYDFFFDICYATN